MPSRDDYCDVCHKRVPRSQLRRKRYRTGREPGHNLVAYSSYNSSWWTVSGTYLGDTACGLKQGLPQVASDNSITVVDGSPEFSGGKVMLTGSAVTGASGAGSVLISVYIGVPPGYSMSAMAFNLKTGANDVSTTITASNAAGRRYWARFTSAQLTAAGVDIGNFVPVISVNLGSATDHVWIDGVQIEKDVDTPGRLIITNGSAITFSQRTVQTGVVAMCPECYAKMRPVKFRTRVRPIMKAIDPPIPTRVGD